MLHNLKKPIKDSVSPTVSSLLDHHSSNSSIVVVIVLVGLNFCKNIFCVMFYSSQSFWKCLQSEINKDRLLSKCYFPLKFEL